MNTTTRAALIATIGLTSAVHAQDFKELVNEIFVQTNNTPIPLLDVRARYEYGNQDGLEASNAGTLRARVGLQSQDYNGFSGLVEFEATRAIDNAGYRDAPYSPPGKTLIPDPESTELNRIQLQYKKNDNLAVTSEDYCLCTISVSRCFATIEYAAIVSGRSRPFGTRRQLL